MTPAAPGAPAVQRRPLFAGNWKMHTLPAEAARLAAAVREGLDGWGGGDPAAAGGTVTPGVAGRGAGTQPAEGPAGPPAAGAAEVVLCPPFTSLAAAAEALAGSAIALGAQDLAWGDFGAFTGEVSAPMLRELGCRYVIVGHSERRQLLGETDALILRKLEAALAGGLVPILCVGEDAAQRREGRTAAVVLGQAAHALAGLDGEQAARVVIAYEPVWAIGSGTPATPADAQAVAAALRGLIERLHGPAVAAAVRILYGGSVKPDNIGGFMAQPDIDGALVGGASLDGAGFARLVRQGVAARAAAPGGAAAGEERS
ncbi:triosephosphate isomerase [Thermaerobacter marianensis DSM 12885]|uniref:Triosephosphate isomerase n=1 Tax=Thermaerobacter marianensis (strain ATCC 700841 / DSM 12885 / JCM 10246 / 7p75a) TaxID=644966 RepID=E6SKU6_THEM7|nr:triose-phosphate isomerase [Thermaerobacter marianensis]ADU52319.1 triosephosphate isomerase [Thermaerobacter marianensis DSM 12885]